VVTKGCANLSGSSLFTFTPEGVFAYFAMIAVFNNDEFIVINEQAAGRRIDF
jgi:hypothetical protein